MPEEAAVEPEGAQMIRQTGDSLAHIAAEWQAICADSMTAAAESATAAMNT